MSEIYEVDPLADDEQDYFGDGSGIEGQHGVGMVDPLGDFNVEDDDCIIVPIVRVPARNDAGEVRKRKNERNEDFQLKRNRMASRTEHVDGRRERASVQLHNRNIPNDRRSASKVDPPQIRLLEHCVFCLRLTKQMKVKTNRMQQVENLLEVPRADVSSSSSTLLQTFNQIWPYLQHKFPDSENLFSFLETNVAKTGKITPFSKLPTMCQFCVYQLKSVDALLQSLGTQMKKLASVIRESKEGGQYSWRAEGFEQALRSATLGREDIRATIEFLLGKKNIDINDFEEAPLPAEEEHNDLPYSTASPACKSEPIGCPPVAGTSAVSISGDAYDEESSPSPGDAVKSDSDPDYIKSEEEDSASDDATDEDDMTSPSFLGTKTEPTPQKNEALRYFKIDDAAQSKKVVTRKVCNVCGKAVSRLKEHMDQKHGKDKLSGYKCELCRDVVPEKEFNEHFRAHVGDEYMMKCPNPKCFAVFCQLASLCHHLKKSKSCREGVPPGVQLPKNIYICEVCGYKTGNALCLRTHLIRSHETSSKNFSCPITDCEQKFTLKQSVALHLPHHDFCRLATSQACDKCHKQFKLDKMEDHLKNSHQIQKIIKCKLCSFLFSSRERFIEHLFDHRYGVLYCDICDDGVKFAQHCQLRDHYFTVHKLGHKYTCEYCGKELWRKVLLTEHVRVKHKNANEQKKVFRCEECNVEYKTSQTLMDHNITVHGAEPYNCTFCDEKFYRRAAYTKHINEHRGVPTKIRKEFKCEVEGCGKIFNFKDLLKRHHSVIHLGETHVCDLCGRKYMDKNALKNHKDSYHLGLRPYICDICGESFGDSNVLKRHKNIHSENRPFACEICGQRFRQKEVLKRHLEAHEKKGADFKPNGPMKQLRKRVQPKKRKA